MAKHVLVTDMVSSLDEGITAPSLGRLLQSRGLRMIIQKPARPGARRKGACT